MKDKIPFRYVGIMHIDNMEDFSRKAMPSKEFQDFVAKWSAMVQPGFHTLMGEEI